MFRSHEANFVPSPKVMFLFHCKSAPRFPEENRLEESLVVVLRAWVGKVFYRGESPMEGCRKVSAVRNRGSSLYTHPARFILHIPN